MARRTKIVATLGPASADMAALRQLVAAGMDMARISLAHGPVEDALRLVEGVRAAAASEDRIVGILVDLPGPKVRTTAFEDAVELSAGDLVMIVDVPGARSRGATIAVDYPGVLAMVSGGDRLRFGDGGVEVLVERVDDAGAVARVLTGGRLQGRPGLSLPDERLTMESPTDQDLHLLGSVLGADVDAIAVSFVRSAADIERVRAVLPPDGPMVIAKIETQAAVDDIESIVAAADGVMVARGDLGIRCALEDVPHFQKQIIRIAVAYGRPVITATQMLESMVDAPTPTRAEASDVANAVLDGTSALMLSAETAVGHDPVLVVQTMARIAERADRAFDHLAWGTGLGRQQHAVVAGAPPSVRITAAISAAAWRASIDADAAAIVACTNTGVTARAIARLRPAIPIVAVTPSPRTARQLSVAWGVTPVISERKGSSDEITAAAVRTAVQLGIVGDGDVVAVLSGSPDEPERGTDILHVVQVRGSKAPA